MIKKVLIVLTVLLCLTGCESKKCLKSHEEDDRCFYIYNYKVGNVYMSYPIYYNCKRTVCDEYEVVKDA